MAGLTAGRDTRSLGEVLKVARYPVKASTKVFKGSMVALNAGFLVPVSTATGLIGVGLCRYDVDNTAGADGALSAEVEEGTFIWDNLAGDLLTQANAGAVVYGTDDHTVNLTATGKSIVGVMESVEPEGIAVRMGLDVRRA